LKQRDPREEKSIRVAVGHGGEKGSKYKEDILPIGGKSEEAADLKKYLKVL